MHLRVLSSLPIGSCTPVMPRSPQITPQAPIGGSKIANFWPVMALLLPKLLSELILGPNLGLEIVAIHPKPEKNPGDQQGVRTHEIQPCARNSVMGTGAVPWNDGAFPPPCLPQRAPM